MTNQIIKVEKIENLYCPSGKNGFDNSFATNQHLLTYPMKF